VIVTLLYLARQIREGSEAQVRGMRNRHEDAVSGDLIGSSDLARILTKIKEVDGHSPLVEAFVERYGLTYEDANRWVRYLMRMWFGMHTDYKFGVVDDHGIRAAFYYPDQALFWHHAKAAFSKDFVEHVESLRPEVDVLSTGVAGPFSRSEDDTVTALEQVTLAPGAKS
ncbi:MAG: hypothetical protein ACR2QG_04225, partial [Gammaproteobacteria bacterium]